MITHIAGAKSRFSPLKQSSGKFLGLIVTCLFQKNKFVCIHLYKHVSGHSLHLCNYIEYEKFILLQDHLCGSVVRVSGYRYRGLGFDSRRYQIF
jgi:hypothetical protein